MVWAGPLFEGHLCSLGYAIVDTIEAYMCHGEGDLQGQPAQVDQEMADHIIECYRLDPTTGRRVYNEAVLSRAKGRAKSEIAAWIVVVEAFFECRFSHWDDDGQPVGKRVESPLIKCLATEEGQAGNTFKTVAFIVGEWGEEHHPDIYAGTGGVRKYQSATAIYLPDGGEIRACTAGAASKDGGLESHVVADETHLYIYDELRAMYATISRNLGKRFEADPWLHQTSTAYAPGERSVFEETFQLHAAGELPPEVFINHRQATGKLDLTDVEQTKQQLREAYGEAANWIDLDRKIRDMRDPRKCKDAAEAARYFLNRPESGDGSWISKAVYDRQNAAIPASETDPRPRPNPLVTHGTAIAIGFDGSLNDDTTVLRGCRMSDGLLFRLGAWAKPPGAAGIGWSVPRLEVLATINETFEIYDVVRGNFDPHEWRSDIDTLAERHGTERVFKFETRSDVRMAAALDRLHSGLTIGEQWHDGDPLASEHYGNAYVTKRGKLRLVRKENPNSGRKIDTVVGDALALEARADALAAGWGKEPDPELPPLVFGM